MTVNSRHRLFPRPSAPTAFASDSDSGDVISRMQNPLLFVALKLTEKDFKGPSGPDNSRSTPLSASRARLVRSFLSVCRTWFFFMESVDSRTDHPMLEHAVGLFVGQRFCVVGQRLPLFPAAPNSGGPC